MNVIIHIDMSIVVNFMSKDRSALKYKDFTKNKGINENVNKIQVTDGQV